MQTTRIIIYLTVMQTTRIITPDSDAIDEDYYTWQWCKRQSITPYSDRIITPYSDANDEDYYTWEWRKTNDKDFYRAVSHTSGSTMFLSLSFSFSVTLGQGHTNDTWYPRLNVNHTLANTSPAAKETLWTYEAIHAVKSLAEEAGTHLGWNHLCFKGIGLLFFFLHTALRLLKPRGLLGTGSPGRPPQLSHSFWALFFKVTLRLQRP